MDSNPTKCSKEKSTSEQDSAQVISYGVRRQGKPYSVSIKEDQIDWVEEEEE